MLSGCAYGATRPPSDVSLTAATLEGTVGDTTQDFTGTWWFEYRDAGVNTGHETPHLTFSVEANTQQPVSSRVTGLDQLGDPVVGTQRVHRLFYRTCVQGDSPPYGPLCSPERPLLTGDYVYGNLISQEVLAIGTVAVDSGPAGEDPVGRLSLDFVTSGDERDLDGTITCLAVEGPFAAMVVDNELGDDALVRLHSGQGGGRLEILEPPADLEQCPDPEAISPDSWDASTLEIGDGP